MKSNEKNNSCPVCRQSPFERRSAKSLKTFFSKININCIHKGCPEHPDYFEYINHIKKCKFKLY